MTEDEAFENIRSRLQADDPSTPESLYREVYAELYALAQGQMRGQRSEHTLQATALVNEVYLRLQSRGGEFNDRNHFVRMAARAMRQILVDYSRRRGASHRPPVSRRVEIDGILDQAVGRFEQRSESLVALDSALKLLETRDPALARLVELHSFGGQTIADCAVTLGISERTALRWWRAARGMLRLEIERESEE